MNHKPLGEKTLAGHRNTCSLEITKTKKATDREDTSF